jgi:hypothetical protein
MNYKIICILYIVIALINIGGSVFLIKREHKKHADTFLLCMGLFLFVMSVVVYTMKDKNYKERNLTSSNVESVESFATAAQKAATAKKKKEKADKKKAKEAAENAVLSYQQKVTTARSTAESETDIEKIKEAIKQAQSAYDECNKEASKINTAKAKGYATTASKDLEGAKQALIDAEKKKIEELKKLGLSNVRYLEYKGSPNNQYNCLVFSQIRVFDQDGAFIDTKTCTPLISTAIGDKEWGEQYGCMRALDGDQIERGQGSGYLGCAEQATYHLDLQDVYTVSKVVIHGSDGGGPRSNGTLLFRDKDKVQLTLNDGTKEAIVEPKGKKFEIDLKSK